MPSIINATTTTGVAVTGDNSGALALQTNNGTTAVTITTGQNVGIGNTTPTDYKLVVDGEGTDGGFALKRTGTLTGSGALRLVGSSGSEALAFSVNATERMRIASDGTISTTIGSTLYGAYPARAWVNFNGTGTPAIRNSRNVSSITDNGTGDYTVNFTTAMPDNEYAVVYGGATDWRTIGADGQANITTSGVRLLTRLPSNAAMNEVDSVALAVFR